MIKGLHHNAYRCRDSEETREFYEDFLGLRFVSAFEIDEGRGLHSFFDAAPADARRQRVRLDGSTRSPARYAGDTASTPSVGSRWPTAHSRS
jgi:catechol 2,3-dioxygenase-like lactoylglutathione lyase family enzyme